MKRAYKFCSGADSYSKGLGRDGRFELSTIQPSTQGDAPMSESWSTTAELSDSLTTLVADLDDAITEEDIDSAKEKLEKVKAKLSELETELNEIPTFDEAGEEGTAEG